MMQDDVEDVVRFANELMALEETRADAAEMRLRPAITLKHSGKAVECDHVFRVTELAWQLRTVLTEAFMWRAHVRTERAIRGED